MPVLENDIKWIFAGSTAVKKAVNLKGNAANISVVYETSSGCTASLAFLHRMGSSAGTYQAIDPSTAMSSRAVLLKQFTGPLEWVKPQLVAITAGATNVVTVYLKGRS